MLCESRLRREILSHEGWFTTWMYNFSVSFQDQYNILFMFNLVLRKAGKSRSSRWKGVGKRAPSSAKNTVYYRHIYYDI